MRRLREIFSGNTNVFLLMAAVLVALLVVVAFVLSTAREKPQSPQAMVAAAVSDLLFSNDPNLFTTKEWKPGMGKQPFLYHPAGVNRPIWRPLPGQDAAADPAPQATDNWRPLSPAQDQGVQAGIRAYTGPAQ